MTQRDLRIYHGPEETCIASGGSPVIRKNITLTAGEVLPLLADAVNSQRTWLRDFEDDMMTISSDLYEVLLAYQHYRRPSA